jgi:hypothetical protein
MRFKVICAWCGTDMGEKEMGDDSDEIVITHSICPECKKRLEEEIKEILRENQKPNNNPN